jgi:hypothetical protein
LTSPDDIFGNDSVTATVTAVAAKPATAHKMPRGAGGCDPVIALQPLLPSALASAGTGSGALRLRTLARRSGGSGASGSRPDSASSRSVPPRWLAQAGQCSI